MNDRSDEAVPCPNGVDDAAAPGLELLEEQYLSGLGRGETADPATWLSAHGVADADAELAGRLHVVELAHALRETDAKADKSTDPWATAVSPQPTVSRRPPVSTDHTDARPTAEHIVQRGALLAGKLHILGRLGAGGMGEVFAAWHEVLGCEVAIKVLPEGAADRHEFMRRFQQSIQAQAKLSGHEHIVTTMDAGYEQGHLYLVMEYFDGEDLAVYLRRRGPLPWREACEYIRQAAQGLAHAHKHGLIHRDIKPANLIRGHDGNIKIIDWGLTRYDAPGAEKLTHSGVLMGTPDYMAPEQGADSKTADTRSDLYSLGCTLYCLLAAKPPFADRPSAHAKLVAHATEAPPSIPTLRDKVPPAVAAIFKRLLAKEPEKRFQSAADLVAALDAIPSDVPTVRRSRRRGVLIAGVVAVAIAATVGGLAWSGRAGPSGDSTPGEVSRSAPATVLAPDTTNPLRVLSIDMQHFARLNQSEAMPRGILGKQSFTPRLGDQVTIDAKLARPAYCYLLAFRPDGVAELCFPESDSQPPPKTDRIRMPSRPDKRYGLQEGTGLWVFGVVASDKPLPAYRDVVTRQQLDWSPSASREDSGNSAAAGAGVVWWYDGAWIEPITASGKAGVERSNSEQALGSSGEVVRATDWLKTASGADTAAAIGFHVAPAQ